MNPLLESFLQEARENLAFIDQNIENLGSTDSELINAVFRAAHTLKGGSGIVGFNAVKEITHHAEDLLDMIREGKIEANDDVIESLYNAFDEVMNLVEAAEESEDIVDADEETLNQIIETLCKQMGKSTQKQEWQTPINLLEDKNSIINLSFNFLRTAKITLPLKTEDITEENFQDKRLYAIVFDVDESCMLYGNDPLYALSLLGDCLIYTYSCMNNDSAKSILSGLDDEDGLNLNLQIIAFVEAPYAEIEEALYNFMDELLFLPLDISTLLSINKGETAPLDIIKELSLNIKKISPSDKDKIESLIEDALTLIGEKSIQYAQLQRLLDVLKCNDNTDYIGSFLDAVAEGKAFNYEDVTKDHQEASIQTNTKERENENSKTKPKQVDENTLNAAYMIVEQQIAQLRKFDDETIFKRAKEILTKTAHIFDVKVPNVSNTQELLEFASSLMSSSDKDLPQEENKQNQEENKIEEKKQTEEKTPKKETEDKKEPTQDTNKKKEKSSKKSNIVGKTVKVEQESVDLLMNIIGELLVAKNSLPYLADSVHKMPSEEIKRAIMEKYTFINRLSEQLQDLIMSMRMLPISYVFDRYPKLVRDISKKLNKKVKLTMEGGETKLDKNIIEMLADPMIHIMRNSLDHGIELPEEREKKGKTPDGNITLKAYSQSDKIIIEIIDDGAGINVDRVIQKVIDKGLMTMEQIDSLDDNAKAELVLLAGLSTAEEITEFSGRGVGMDVVKKSIEGFGGNINIKTATGKGTTITLSIPVSLAITSLLHVEMDDVHYGFPMDSVQETVKIDKDTIEYLHNKPFIYLRGEVIPLVFINSMLNIEKLENKQLSIAVLSVKGNALAVVVNNLLGQLDVVQKPLSGILDKHPIFSGTALLGNGQIIMMIDPVGLLSICDQLQVPFKEVS